jgi:hypothetical protein
MIDGVETDKDPNRLTELERQKQEIKRLAKARKERERLKKRN